MKYIFSVIILMLSVLLSNSLVAQESHDFEISKNLDIYTSLIQQLNLHYVDEIKPGELSKSAIDAMLAGLDPYTVYYPESEIEDVRFLQTGQYGGIGSFIHQKNGKFYVGTPHPGFPFHRAGIRAGDQLLKIDNESVDGKTMDEISDRLRGVAGTEITITYQASKDQSVKQVLIKREEIEVKDVPYFGMIDKETAYIKLESFKQRAAEEVKLALDSLSKTNSITSLVLDLRDNGGGLLFQAVEIVNLFVESNELIVSTKGKTKEETFAYRTQHKSSYPALDIVVLINERSASASEIVAGALQDLDRAVVLGQKSYGKGLVQKVFPLSYRAQTKITVAKYYIPSGRCIQSMDYLHKDANGKAIKTPDSLMATFKTKNGRLVKDAGGIIPDVITQEAENSELIIALTNQLIFFDFATQYFNNQSVISNFADFKIEDDLYALFLKFVDEAGFKYQNSVELQISKLEEMSLKNHLSISKELEILKNKLADLKKEEFNAQQLAIKNELLQEIASRYFYFSGRVEAQLRNDQQVREAQQLLQNKTKYQQLLIPSRP